MGEAPEWHHTNVISHPILFKIMNELYSKFLKHGDVIMLHDYEETEEEYQDKVLEYLEMVG